MINSGLWLYYLIKFICGDDMNLIYNNKKIEIIKCKSFYSRLKGFMFCKEIKHALLFERCNSIHTFFMRKNIDVIMCDRNDTILYYFNNVGKNKIILPKKNVYKTIELPVDYFDIKVNKKIEVK